MKPLILITYNGCVLIFLVLSASQLLVLLLQALVLNILVTLSFHLLLIILVKLFKKLKLLVVLLLVFGKKLGALFGLLFLDFGLDLLLDDPCLIISRHVASSGLV